MLVLLRDVRTHCDDNMTNRLISLVDTVRQRFNALFASIFVHFEKYTNGIVTKGVPTLEYIDNNCFRQKSFTAKIFNS